MHEGLGTMLGDRDVDGRAIGEIADDERRARMHRRAMPLREIIEHDDRLVLGHKLLDDHTADIPGPAGDEDFHGRVFRAVCLLRLAMASFKARSILSINFGDAEYLPLSIR